MIDDQVHFREPGLEYKADIATESAAAVAGGLTSFMDMPNTNPPTLDARGAGGQVPRAPPAAPAPTSASTWAPATTTSKRSARSTRCTAPGIKVFMGASTGNMLVDNPETLDAIFRDAPTPIITHCEDTPMIDAELARVQGEATATTSRPSAMPTSARARPA